MACTDQAGPDPTPSQIVLDPGSQELVAQPGAPDVDAFAHSADATDVIAYWERLPEGIEASNRLSLVARSNVDEPRTVVPRVFVSGLDDRAIEVELPAVELPAGGEVAVPIELAALPLQGVSHSVQLLASITVARDGGEATIHAEPLAFHFDEGYRTASVYTLDTMVTALDGGLVATDLRSMRGRVREGGTFTAIGATSALTDPAAASLPSGVPQIEYTYEIAAADDDLSDGASDFAAQGDPSQAPGQPGPGTTPGNGGIGPSWTCQLWPWNCCSGDNCVDVCADWTTSYVDSSGWSAPQHEDYAVGSGTQLVDASYAEYQLKRTVCNGWWCYVAQVDSGVLGPDGCAQIDVSPGSGYSLQVSTRMQYGGKTYPVEYHPQNDAASNVGVVSVAKSFSYLPGTPLPPPLVTLPFHPAGNASAMISRALASGTVVDQPSGFVTKAGLGCSPSPGIPPTDACAGSSIKTGPYTNPDNSAGDLRWKFILAHEFGHVMQGKAMGGLSNPYCFTPQGTVTYDCAAPNLADHPNAPASCSCDHVSGSNGLHCLQSWEHVSAAQIEGFAQFYAARVWNDPGSGCLFRYYKQ
ncbi:MAG: hypothetical protein K0V04_05500, partial [Deltaproteobacteria bacterium]|nr:hypothetical protein [Deltaproteobacteria bacterium]